MRATSFSIVLFCSTAALAAPTTLLFTPNDPADAHLQYTIVVDLDEAATRYNSSTGTTWHQPDYYDKTGNACQDYGYFYAELTSAPAYQSWTDGKDAVVPEVFKNEGYDQYYYHKHHITGEPVDEYSSLGLNLGTDAESVHVGLNHDYRPFTDWADVDYAPLRFMDFLDETWTLNHEVVTCRGSRDPFVPLERYPMTLEGTFEVVPPSTVPEPTTLSLLAIGIAGLARVRRRFTA